MSKLFSRHALAVLALAFPVAALADTTLTLSANSTLNLDTGAMVTSGGDFLWTGTSFTMVGSAQALDLTALTSQGGSSFYSTPTSALTKDFGAELAPTAVTPKANDVLIYQTNGSNFGKMLVESISGTSITVEFDTFGGSTSSSGGPNITAVQNNYSNLIAGLPNYGIAPGSLFVIYGTAMATTSNLSEKFPLATSLNGVSVSVSVNGTPIPDQPGLYYVTATQIAGVLPSTAPTGQATFTVTNGTQASNSFQTQIVQSAFGLDTIFGGGTGQAVVTDANYKVIESTYSASPGQVVILWGSGVGPDTNNDDKTYPAAHLDNLTSIPMTAYIGGISASIAYRGRSQYPGVDQVVLTIPDNVTPGCNVSIVLVSGSGSTASNFGTVAVNPNGGVCSDPNSPYNITGLTGLSTVNFGFLAITSETSTSLSSSPFARPATSHSTSVRTLSKPFSAPLHPRATSSSSDDAIGFFYSIQGSEFGNYASYQTASLGSCVVYQEVLSTTPTTPFKETPLNAGTITVKGPAGTQTLTELSLAGELGLYDVQLPAGFIPSSGGSFVFNGTGATGTGTVGPLTATVNLSAPLFSWTNMSTTTSVTRSAGVPVSWEGGESGTYVEISGFSDGSSIGAGFYCLAKQEDLHFTVPSWVTESLPAGTGSLDVVNISNPVSFTATNLNFGFALAEVDNVVEEIPYN
jgi:uncharacterized protein (TIGR03437 family)